ARELHPGALRYVLEAVPWAGAALLFGLLVREALEPIVDGAQTWSPAPSARAVGIAVSLLILISGGVHGISVEVESSATSPRFARRGQVAPPVDLPMLGSTQRLGLSSLRGRPVVLSF